MSLLKKKLAAKKMKTVVSSDKGTTVKVKVKGNKLKTKLAATGNQNQKKGFLKQIAQMKGGDVLSVDLNQVAEREYYEYGVAVIEDRAIFSAIDGLKPVARRSLYTINELGLHNGAKADKSAKAVGSCLGNYHPHGDKACYDAIVNAAVNQNIPMVHGEGNFGTMTEGPAAMRYTNLKLSKYSDLVFFDKFYMPTVEYVPNYDGSRKEPLVLPALLPNAVLNGNFGIAPGVNTRSPMFTLESVAKVIQKTLDNTGVCTPEMCMGLEFTTATGGAAVRTKANKSEFLEFFKSGRGRVTFTSTCTPVDKNNSIRFDHFAPISDMEKVMTKIEEIKGVQNTRDDSDEKDPFKTAFVITFVKTLKGAALDAAIKQVHAYMTSTYTFDVKVTDRFIRENGQAGARLRATTIPQMIENWLEYRIGIEIKACQYWMQEAENRIAYLELMRKAIANIDLIIKHIKNKKLDDAALVKALMKSLKITDEQANMILSRNLRQLRHLEDQKLVDGIKELKKEISGYAGRIKKPAVYISQHVTDILTKVKKKASR